MSITMKCRCGKTLVLRDEAAGKTFSCPGCGHPLDVPGPVLNANLEKVETSSEKYHVACECGKVYGFDRKNEGKLLACACGAEIVLPWGPSWKTNPYPDVPPSTFPRPVEQRQLAFLRIIAGKQRTVVFQLTLLLILVFCLLIHACTLTFEIRPLSAPPLER